MACSKFGSRFKLIRKILKLTQEALAAGLGIDRGHVGNIENESRYPSENLIKHFCLRYGVSETWLKTGEGEMFISPEENLEHIIARFGERAFLDAVSNVMKGTSLVVAAGRPTHRANTGDPDLDRMINVLYDLWAAGDDRLKNWASVQFDRAFPADVVEDVQKKQKEPLGEPQIS